jgi:hypothetical protein
MFNSQQMFQIDLAVCQGVMVVRYIHVCIFFQVYLLVTSIVIKCLSRIGDSRQEFVYYFVGLHCHVSYSLHICKDTLKKCK